MCSLQEHIEREIRERQQQQEVPEVERRLREIAKAPIEYVVKTIKQEARDEDS